MDIKRSCSLSGAKESKKFSKKRGKKIHSFKKEKKSLKIVKKKTETSKF